MIYIYSIGYCFWEVHVTFCAVNMFWHSWVVNDSILQKKAIVQHLYLGRNPPIITEMRVFRQCTDDDHLVFVLGVVSLFELFALSSCKSQILQIEILYDECRFLSWEWIFSQLMIWVQYLLWSWGKDWDLGCGQSCISLACMLKERYGWL